MRLPAHGPRLNQRFARWRVARSRNAASLGVTHLLPGSAGSLRLFDMVKPSDYANLSVSERLQLVEDIWDSIARDTGAVSVPDEVLDEAERRLAEHRKDPGSAIPGEQVRAELRKRGR